MVHFKRAVWVWSIVLAACGNLSAATENEQLNAPSGTHITLYPSPVFEGAMAGYLPAILTHEAVLLSLREELQIDLVDGVFQDRTTDPLPVAAYALDVLASMAGKLSFQLRSCQPVEGKPGRLGEKGEAIWSLEFPIRAGSKVTFPSLIPQLESATRKEMVEIARQLNLTGQANRILEKSKLPLALATQLSEMDCVTQFQAARAAHHLIRSEGESPELLGALIRAYAHLGVLTRLHCFEDTDVFSARALLYAHRLVARYPDQPLARWYRAYAFALAGMHLHALEDLEWLDAQTSGPRNYPEAWCRLVEPICSFDEKELLFVAASEPALEQTGYVLRFLASMSKDNAGAILERGAETLQHAPGDFDVYYRLAATGLLRLQRWGASVAPVAIRERLLDLCARGYDLPQSVREVAASSGTSPRNGFNLFGLNLGGQTLSLLEVRALADALRNASTQESFDGLPWNILARLLDEELFMIADVRVQNATNAVASDLSDLVDELKPIVDGHRYQPYIASYSYSNVAELAARRAVLDRMTPGVMRWHMRGLMADVRYYASPEVASLFVTACSREFTAPELEVIFSVYAGELPAQKMFANELRHVSPRHPLVLQFAISSATDPGLEKLMAWEEVSLNDRLALHALAQQYWKLNKPDDAVRCYERSLGIGQNYAVATELSHLYWYQGKYELWQTTLEDFAKVPSYGLEDSMARMDLAQGFIALNRLDEALPHALEAAETYSGRGLMIAAQCYEVRQEYQLAEKYWRAAAESYDGSSRFCWYFFCCRRGVGNRQAAWELARTVIDASEPSEMGDLLTLFAAAEMMAGSMEKAIEFQQLAVQTSQSVDAYIQLGALAVRSDDAVFRQATAEMLGAHLTQSLSTNSTAPDASNNNQSNASPTSVEQPTTEKISDETTTPQPLSIEELCRKLEQAELRRLRNESVDDETIQQVLDQLRYQGDGEKISIYYLLGEILASQEDDQRAAGMWQAAVGNPLNVQQSNASLAGFRLLQHPEIEPHAWPALSK